MNKLFFKKVRPFMKEEEEKKQQVFGVVYRVRDLICRR